MRNDSTISVVSNSIRVYICRKVNDSMQLLLLNRDSNDLSDWGVSFAEVKTMEMCWQAALNEVRTDTSAVPDRIYSVDYVETSYDVKSHCIKMVPVFVALFDYEQETIPMLPSVKSMWIAEKDVPLYLSLAHEREVVALIKKEYFDSEPTDDYKVYPTRF